MIIDKIRAKIKDLKENSINPELVILSPQFERYMFLDGSFEKSEQFTDIIRVDGKEYKLINSENVEIEVYGRQLFTK